MSGGTHAGRTVLVTGAQGFIGSWLAERLLDEGATVLVPRRPAPKESRFCEQDLDRRCEGVQLDLLDLASVLRALDEHRVDTVFHLAARTVVSEADRSPLPVFEVNVRGTTLLLEACRLAAARGEERRVVIASSAHVYGRRGDSARSEKAALRPGGPYDVSKACVDMIARCYAVTHEMPVAVTRMSNVFGGGDLNYSRLVPAAARALVQGDAPVIESDGKPERDYLYVEDAVEAYLAVEGSLADQANWGRAWNAGGDSLVSVGAMVESLIEAAGASVAPDIRGEGGGEGGADQRLLDSSAAREELGWGPSTPLDSALQSTYAWYRDSA